MHRFKPGQKVVSIKDHSQGFFKKGQVFTIEFLSCCKYCGAKSVAVAEIKGMWGNTCICKKETDGFPRSVWYESCFAPLQNNADAIEYRLNVSIKELEVKEYQNQ